MSFLSKRFLLPLAALLFMVCAPMMASAADTSFLNFNSSKSVYVDPQLTNDPNYPVNIDADKLESQLRTLSGKEGAQYYVVFEKSDPTAQIPSQYHGLYADWQLDDLFMRWAGKSGFSPQKSVVIMLVRSAKNPNAFSYAGDAGSDWQTAGLSKQYFASALPALKKQFENDPNGFFVAAATDANTRIAAVHTQVTQAASHKAFMKFLPYGIVFVLCVLCLVGFFLYKLSSYNKAKKLLNDALSTWEPKLASATAVYLRLNGEYLDSLKNQSDWKGKFKGATLVQYTTAVTAYSSFAIHMKVANDLLAKAKSALTSAGIFSPAALTIAYLSLTETDIVIEGSVEQELKAVVDLFGGLVKKETLKPAALLDGLQRDYNNCNTSLASIFEAVRSAKTNKDAIAATLEGITALEAEVAGVGLSFTPFAATQTDLNTRAAATIADIDSDPVGVVNLSTSLHTAVDALRASIEQAVSLKKDVLRVGTTISQARAKVAAKRAEAVEFKFAPATGTTTFTLSEGDFNPDGALTEAEGSLKTFDAALSAGKVTDAEAAKQAALSSVALALSFVDGAVAAKKHVDDNASAIATEFSGTGAYNSIATSYGKQDFAAAAELVDVLLSLGALQTQSSALSAALSDKAVILSSVTTSKVMTATSQVSHVIAAYKATPFDRARASELRNQLTAYLTTANEAIAADVVAFNAATTAVTAFHTAYNASLPIINDPRVNQARRDSLTRLNDSLTALLDSLRANRNGASNWASVTAQADAGTTSVGSLMSAAQSDIDAAIADAAALTRLQAVEAELSEYSGRRYIRTFGIYSYGGLVSFNSSQPNRYLARAEQAYRNRDYAAMHDALDEVKEAIYQADTRAWYDTMELMYESNDVMARRYAFEHGFVAGVTYEAWYGDRFAGVTDYSQPWQPVDTTDWQPSRESAHLDPSYVEPEPDREVATRREDDGDDGTGNAGGGQDRDFDPPATVARTRGRTTDPDPTPDDERSGNSGGGQDDNF